MSDRITKPDDVISVASSEEKSTLSVDASGNLANTEAKPYSFAAHVAQTAAARPHSFASNITVERDHNREKKVDRSLLATQAGALLSSVEIAIGKLQNQIAAHPSAKLTKQMAEYQAIEQNVQTILSALSGGHDSTAALSRLQSSIQSDFSFWEDSEEHKDDSPLGAPHEIYIEPVVRPIDEHPLMRRLMYRHEELSWLLWDDETLRTQAEARVDMGKADLKSSVALAALLYDAYQNNENPEFTQAKVAEFLEAKKNEMRAVAGETSSSEEDVEARARQISETANYLHEGALKSPKDAGERLLKATEFFVTQPMIDHMELYDVHSAKVGAHFKMRAEKHMGRHAHDHLIDHKKREKEWKDLKDRTLHHHTLQIQAAEADLSHLSVPVNGGGAAFYEALAKATHTHEAIHEMEHYKEKYMEIAIPEYAMDKHVHDKTLETHQILADVLTGHSTDMDVAYQVGIRPQDLRLAVVDNQVQDCQHVDESLFKQVLKDSVDRLTGHGRGVHQV